MSRLVLEYHIHLEYLHRHKGLLPDSAPALRKMGERLSINSRGVHQPCEPDSTKLFDTESN